MSSLMMGQDIVAACAGLISAKKQVGSFSLDLTLREIGQVSSGGALDFGGSEYNQAAITILEPEKRSPEEPYGWWKLGPGNYLMRFSETLEFQPPALIIILPHSKLIAAGASHAPIAVESLDKDACVLLQVGPDGLSIKQNARVSTAIVLTTT
jgi:hypothetical protein